MAAFVFLYSRASRGHIILGRIQSVSCSHHNIRRSGCNWLFAIEACIYAQKNPDKSPLHNAETEFTSLKWGFNSDLLVVTADDDTEIAASLRDGDPVMVEIVSWPSRNKLQCT